MVSLHRHFLVAHLSGGFDSWVILNSLVKEITETKYIKTARGLILLSFWCGVKKIIQLKYLNMLNLHVQNLT